MSRTCARVAWLFMLIVSLGALTATSARAEVNPPGYDAAIDEALAAFDRGKFAEARELFLRAHKLLPNARTLRALGKAEYELKRYDEAATHLSLAIGSDVRPLTAPQRADAELLLRKSEDYLATYTLKLTPPDAALRLDGRPAALDANDALRLIVGEHVLEASAPEHLPWRREMTVLARIDETIFVELTARAEDLSAQDVSDEGVSEPSPAAPLRDDAPPKKRRWLLWTSVSALVLAGVITGVVLATRAPGEARASGGNTDLVWTLGDRK